LHYIEPSGGIAADQFGEKKVLILSFFSLMLFIMGFTIGFGAPILFVLVFFLGWFINFNSSPSFSIVPTLFGSDIAGGVSGILNTFAAFGALILPFLLGYIRDINNSYDIGWYAVAILALTAPAIMYLVTYSEP
jgi:nitrate/nitrite transporter NarK